MMTVSNSELPRAKAILRNLKMHFIEHLKKCRQKKITLSLQSCLRMMSNKLAMVTIQMILTQVGEVLLEMAQKVTELEKAIQKYHHHLKFKFHLINYQRIL